MPTSIRSTAPTAPSAAENGNGTLPFLATFAAHNSKRQVAHPRKPASIQHSRAYSPRDNVKSGKSGNVHHPGQHCHLHLTTLPLHPPP